MQLQTGVRRKSTIVRLTSLTSMQDRRHCDPWRNDMNDVSFEDITATRRIFDGVVDMNIGFIFRICVFKLILIVGSYAELTIRFQDFWKSNCRPIIAETINCILDDLSWFQTLLSFNSKYSEANTCAEYIATNAEVFGTWYDIELPEELISPTFQETVALQLEEIWKTSGLLDSIPLEISAVSKTTWCLFFSNFILALILCLNTIMYNDEELPVYITSHCVKARSGTLYKKIKNPIFNKRHQPTSHRTLQKLKKRKTIPSYLIKRQIKAYLTDREKHRQQNIMKLKRLSPRRFVKKQSRSDLEIGKRSKVKTPQSLEGKIYNLNSPEDIPWEILDILLCIKSPCFDHDHDHVCVVGNHVYTIPKWSIPKTTRVSEKSSPDQSINVKNSNSEDSDDEIIMNTVSVKHTNTFQPIKPAEIIDITDTVERPQAMHLHDTKSQKNQETSPGKREKKIISLEFITPKPLIDPIGSESTDLEDEYYEDNPTTYTDKAQHAQKDVNDVCNDPTDIVSSSQKTNHNTSSYIQPFISIRTTPVAETNFILNEDEIGLPCANSSFKTEFQEFNNGLSKVYIEDTENSWIEDDSFFSSRDHFIPNETKSFHQDLSLSSYLHNVSSRLLKNSQDIHHMSRTLSLYGHVSALELASSWLVGGLLSQVIDDLNISSLAESLVSNISARANSVINITG